MNHRIRALKIIFAFMSVAVVGCVTVPSQLPPTQQIKRIALTYDDAPTGQGPVFSGEERTRALIKQFFESGSGPVTIFVTTKGVDDPQGRERINSYANAGHLIANHSHSHFWASRTPIEDYLFDIDVAAGRLEGIENIRPWFRFPFLDEGGIGKENSDGVKRDGLRAGLAERGLVNAYVTIDTYDWHLENLWKQALKDNRSVDMDALSRVYVEMVIDSANHYDNMALDVFGRRPPQVLLLHENDLAASFTADLVRSLKDDGWEIVSADVAYSDIIASQKPETLLSYKGLIAALAYDQGRTEREYFYHWGGSRKGIEEIVEAYNVFSDDP